MIAVVDIIIFDKTRHAAAPISYAEKSAWQVEYSFGLMNDRPLTFQVFPDEFRGGLD